MENPDENIERDLRLKLIYATIAGALTFFVHPRHIHYHRIFAHNVDNDLTASHLWLQFIITLKNNVLMYTSNESQLPSNLRMFLRLVESIGVYLEPTMTTTIEQDTSMIHDLIRKQWSRAVGASFTSIEFHGTFPQILVVEAMLGPATQIVTIDIIAGIFLVDGLPLCRLPSEITQSEVYRWFFANVAFEVQPDAQNNYSTVQKYNGCSYDFKKAEKIIITERTAEGAEKELIHHENLKGDFPYLLVINYSHWWNQDKNCIEFRKRTFGREHFSKETSIDYELDLSNSRLVHVATGRPMLDIKSNSYINIMKQLIRLEHRKYIHVLMDSSQLAKVELVRMNLKFKIDGSKMSDIDYDLESNEFSGMRVSCTQNIGTLYGLNHGLILESSTDANTRMLLIPHGNIRTECTETHVTVDVDTENELRNPPFFQYQVDEFCKQIKANNRSYSSWFYLAYLHAVTSHGEVEPFIGMSGTERALQILQSSFCWSPSPYEPEAVKILTATAELTPVRNLKENYYQIVAWPKRVHPRAAQDCFVFIVKKLFADSQRMPELYFKDSKTFNTKGNLRLNERDHRRCQQLNPNLCVLSTFIEHKDLKTSLPKPIYVSFAPNTQTVSILYHRKEYSVPSSLELKSFLTGGLQLNGIANMQCLPNLLIHNVYEGFRDLWIRLYDAARKQQFNSEQFALIMSVFAHENEKIEQICSLQSVAMNPNAFADIDPPQVNVFEISKGTCEAHKVSSIIRECHIKPHEYDYHEWYETGKRRAHDHELDAIIRKITDEVTRSWPCDSVNLIGKWSFSFIDFQKANAAINVMLTIWNNNRRLGIFIDKVEERLKSLAVSGLDITLPVYSPFVEPVPRNWCKFKIDFDEKARESLNSFGEAIEEARYVWETKTDESTRTAKEWWTIIENILNSGKSTHFIQAGTFPRMVPSLLLPRIATKETDERLKALIGAWAMAIAHEQRDKRIELYSQRNELKAAMDKEIENKPHLNWKPSKYPEWLLFEIEQNLTIRRIQIEVAERMIEPPKKVGNDAKHSVMQLNMGEGKTAVIVPILAAVLADGTQACQIVVLKSLFATNLNSLRQYLGGMLNRRIYTFPCRRDMPITQYCDQMLSIYEECKREKGVIITLPEYFLSFQLKMYELIQKGNIAAAQRVLNVVKWIHENVRIILDESDAILQPKYQLIYTVGNQMPPDGGSQRWIIAQAILKRVPYHMERLCAKYGEKMIEFDSKYVENGHVFGSPTVNFRSDVFTPCRIIDGSMFEKLKSELIEDFLDGRLDIDFSEIVASKKEPLKLILNERAIDKRSFEVVKDFSLTEQNIVLILSGLLRFEVLKLVLTKRWRVNYGVDENGRRKMAIPFKAKDVAAELTEFGHPDVAICFTQMSYYYSGLTDAQLYKVFSVLENTQDAAATYEKWIQSISPKLIDASIQSYTGVNLDDPNQRDTLLFPLLRFNMHVVDFWLSNVVFPHEMKIFENKLMCTAWDLCSDRLQQRVTGFSGTNDTKNILPLPIQQNDLEELESTNENMRQILLRPENQTYECLPSNVSGKQILERLIERHIPVLLDSGALMLELNNQQVAIEWLKMSPFTSFDAAVYFDSKDVLQTIDRSGNVTAFDCSVYRENLSKCLVYLDDVHTRGTDLKFPLKWKACVTLSGDITRDKTVQSCMRMRQLGKTHSISFWASFETNIRIRKICDLSPDHQVTNENVIDFICSNSRHFETANMVHWAAAAFNYTKKLIGHKMFENIPDENSLTELYRICVDNEFVELSKMYGDKEEALLIQIAQSKLDNLAENLPADEEVRSQIEETKSKLIDKLNEQAPNLKQFTHALDEEQEKELEQELEEQREVERPPPAQAATPIFDQRLVQLVRDGSNDGIIASMKRDGALLSIAKSLSHTQLFRFCANNEDAWADHLLVTKDFKTVIVSSSPTCDEFLRPVWWIGQVKSANGKQDILMLLSSHECNHLLPIFRKSTKATLFVYRPRLSKFHSNLLHEPKLQVPELSEVSRIDIDDEVQIGIYAGMMYFCSEAEQDVYCGFLGLIPRPRTTEQDKAFEEGLIQPKGFVPMENRQHSEAISSCVGQCKFKDNPVDLAIKLIEAHHQALPKMSHAASILVRGIKRNDITGEEKEDYFKEWLLTQTQRN